MKRDKFKKNAASAGDVEACEGGWIDKEKLYWLSFYDKIDCMDK